MAKTLRDRLRDHITGKIERGEGVAIVGKPVPEGVTIDYDDASDEWHVKDASGRVLATGASYPEACRKAGEI